MNSKWYVTIICVQYANTRYIYNYSGAHSILVYRHECHPTYVRVTLDRTLSYREHLTKTAGKLRTETTC